MSLWVIGGVAMGCWAMLSVLSGERYRLKLETEAEKRAHAKALLQAEAGENAVLESHGH